MGNTTHAHKNTILTQGSACENDLCYLGIVVTEGGGGGRGEVWEEGAQHPPPRLLPKAALHRGGWEAPRGQRGRGVQTRAVWEAKKK